MKKVLGIIAATALLVGTFAYSVMAFGPGYRNAVDGGGYNGICDNNLNLSADQQQKMLAFRQ
ncbi:MAG TPA: hypothetical protein VEC37_06510 [Bacillota bacterium]|nr:hypothetical protein [Bacillota bacterium]